MALALLSSACASRERPPDVSTLSPSARDSGLSAEARSPAIVIADAGSVAPPSCMVALEDGWCACSEVGQRPTSLYLVLDRSGSMETIAPGSSWRIWDLMRLALLQPGRGVLRALGTRIAVGAAVFPYRNDDACAPGKPVFPLTAGSDATYTRLAELLAGEVPYGGTPTAATLTTLLPTLKDLPRPAYLLLATDGAPNCGAEACTADHCSYNVEKMDGCDALTNCCDPEERPNWLGKRGCVDALATRQAVAAIAEAGVPVFVLGAPGTEMYAAELGALAEAGGTAREVDAGVPKYYAATNATQEALEAALGAIASRVIESCTVALDTAVEDPGATNVLLDGVAVPPDPVDGWSWVSSHSVRLNGRACARIEARTVTRVQVVVGCRTIVR